jgi:WD40 repeat protein
LLASGGDDGLLRFWTIPTSAGAAPTSPDIDIFANTIASAETYSVAFWPTGNYVAVGGGGYADLSGSGSLTAWAVASPRAEVGTEYDTTNSYDVVSVAVAPDASFIIGGEGDCGCVIACRQ